MPPKCSRRSGKGQLVAPKAKKAKAKAGLVAQNVVGTRGASPAKDEVQKEEQISPGKRIQENRRDIDDQVRRIMAVKLQHIDQVSLKTKTNKQGVGVFDFIKNAVASCKKWNGRLSTQFWTKFWGDFDIARDIPSELPPPPEGEEDDAIDEELIEALSLARHKNPAEMSPNALSHYLENCSKMSVTSLFGVVNAVQSGPSLCSSHALKLQLSLCKYFARLP